MRSRFLGSVFALACTSVRIDPAGGGGDGGAPIMPNAGGAAAGAAAPGGEGGGEPGPVPGCEALSWAGAPILIPSWVPQEVLLARLGGGAVGVVYVDSVQGFATRYLRSLVIDGAFEDWSAATISEPVIHKEDDLLFGSASLTAQDDGTFALVDSEIGIYRFGEPGILLETTPPYTYPFVDPVAGAYFIEQPEAGPLRFYKRATLEPLAIEEELGEVPRPDFCSTAYAELGDEPTFLFASRGYCNFEEDAAWAQFYQLGPTQMQVVSMLPLPIFPTRQALAPRAGGFWYAISNEQETHVYRLTPTTATIGEPFVYEDDGAVDARSFSAWRDGFVLSDRRLEGVTLFVSNGEQITTAPVGEPGPIPSLEETRMLVGGDREQSILISVPLLDHIAIWRADCVTP